MFIPISIPKCPMCGETENIFIATKGFVLEFVKCNNCGYSASGVAIGSQFNYCEKHKERYFVESGCMLCANDNYTKGRMSGLQDAVAILWGLSSTQDAMDKIIDMLKNEEKKLHANN